MNEETVVAVFDSASEAEAAVRDLKGVVQEGSISRHAAESRGNTNPAPRAREPGFWSSLFGGEPDHDTSLYDRSLESGGVVVTVKAAADQATRVTEILERHHPVDLNERASNYGLTTGVSGMGAKPATAGTITAKAGAMNRSTSAAMGGASAATNGVRAAEGDRMTLSEETMTVGKRAVDRGTTRVRRFVIETPVEEQVTLRDEKVSIERHPVTDGRPVSAADFSEKVVEMTETGEEAVIGKSAHVREEVVLSKTATERVETVHDTVRREDVRIETDAETATGKPGMRPAAPPLVGTTPSGTTRNPAI